MEKVLTKLEEIEYKLAERNLQDSWRRQYGKFTWSYNNKHQIWITIKLNMSLGYYIKHGEPEDL